MGIATAFDPVSEEILKPSFLAPPVEGFPETVLVTFKPTIAELAVSHYGGQEISEMFAGVRLPIYGFSYQGKPVGLYLTVLGGPATVGLMEEAIAKGARKLVFFGSCGVLDNGLAPGHVIVPTAAYRDEGTSYHCAPAGDFIEVETADRLSGILAEMGIPFIRGKTWTTDAIYRETKDKMERLKRLGCITVEMECASVMAAGRFRGVEVYQYLYAEDSLDGHLWDARTMGAVPQSACEQYLSLALEIAVRI